MSKKGSPQVSKKGSPQGVQKSKSVATFRVREGASTKKERIVVEYKNDSPQMRKKKALPGSL